ncbi:MAG: ACT domain-containing protein [Gemmatimonas sp.]
MKDSPHTPRAYEPVSVGLTVLAAPLAICRFAATDPLPAWTDGARTLLSISRTPDELSIVADAAAVPSDVPARRDYRALRVNGPLPLDLVGVLSGMATALSAAGVPIFAIATHDTDYILVPGALLATAIDALVVAGYAVNASGQ